MTNISKPYDVVLIPPREVCKKAIALSERLKARGTYFTLDGKTYFPHLSLYMLELSDAVLPSALMELGKIATHFSPFDLIARDYHFENGYIDVEYVKSSKLSSLQDEIVEKLNPYRSGLREKDRERLLTAEGPEQEYIRKVEE